MSQVWTIKPPDGWQVGDRAYCVRGERQASIEVGRVYEISEVIPVPGSVDDGVNLAGVLPPKGMRGFWGGRFVKLHSGGRMIDQITSQTTAVWADAYKASTKRNPVNG